MTPQHGAKTGNELSCSEADVMYAGGFARMLCYCARQLGETPSPADSLLWEVRPLKCYSEKLVRQAVMCVDTEQRWSLLEMHAECGVGDVPMLHTLTGWARPGQNLTTN